MPIPLICPRLVFRTASFQADFVPRKWHGKFLPKNGGGNEELRIVGACKLRDGAAGKTGLQRGVSNRNIRF